LDPQELGTLLGVAPDKAEQVAADMISEGRLNGVIDQVCVVGRWRALLEGKEGGG
jgi:hypothetical protein